jgi:hypothetical protein
MTVRDGPESALETGLVVIADAEITRLVLDVVLQEEAGLGLEIGPVRSHQVRFCVGDLGTMRDRRAAGECRGTDRGGRVRMHPDPLAQRLRLAAGGENLLVAERLPAALADAFGGENLDNVGAVGAVGHGLADMRSNLLDREARVRQRGGRGQQPRPGKPI